MDLNKLKELDLPGESPDQMPVLFVGHGSPMNAIENNEFSMSWQKMGNLIPKPKAILSISAHWETRGTFVTASESPLTIHDFGGFPQELYEVEYPARGSTELARETSRSITQTKVGLDFKWGLDHGSWSVLRHIYPDADIPVIQLSLDYYQPPLFHFELAKELASLRSKGILILGSGNMVHNLRMVDWNHPEKGYDWASEASDKMKNFIITGNNKELINYKSQGKAFELSVPTPEHFLPLLYILALRKENEEVTFFNDKTIMGSLSMTSLKIG